MRQNDIEQTLQIILNQIHGSENNNAKDLTAAQIVRIFLNQDEREVSQPKPHINSNNKDGMLQIDLENFDFELQQVNNHWQLFYYRPITSYRKFIAGLVVLGKRIIRRLLKFLIEPLVEEQGQFNAATARVLNSVRNQNLFFQEAINNLYQENVKIRNVLNENIYNDIDYFEFQNEMRGSFDEIKKRQLQYLPYFKASKCVIDLGCGRGEFLDLLREHNIKGIGVDAYNKSVEFCQARGLSVVEEDVIEFLKGQKDDSIDGVFSAQLIEHISAGKILQLCHESFRIMKKESYIVLETPNPMCLSTYMNSFYLDPSHKNPVHPHLMEYFLHQCGYRDIRIIFPKEEEDYRLPLLDAGYCKNLKEFNDGVNLLSDIIFGSQNYAIVARK